MSKRKAIFLAAAALVCGALVYLSPEFGSVAKYPAALAAERNLASFQTITSGQLARMLSRKDFLFVNVHVPYEGEIKDTDAFIPYDQIAANLDKLPKDRNAKIVLYCRSGRMSEIAAQQLVELGYTQVAHLSGGMSDWKKSGHEVLEK
jgi:rhodanese-related sulfurtransferase